MQRMWRQMFAAVAGVVVVAGFASAQAPALLPLPMPPAEKSYKMVMPSQVAAAPAKAAAGPVTPAAGQVYIKGSGSCSSCGTGTGAGIATGAAVPNGCYDKGCNHGCGSFKADCGFIFGSCKSFFHPCGPLGGHGANCGAHPFGIPHGKGYNGCCYDTYLNH